MGSQRLRTTEYRKNYVIVLFIYLFATVVKVVIVKVVIVKIVYFTRYDVGGRPAEDESVGRPRWKIDQSQRRRSRFNSQPRTIRAPERSVLMVKNRGDTYPGGYAAMTTEKIAIGREFMIEPAADGALSWQRKDQHVTTT